MPEIPVIETYAKVFVSLTIILSFLVAFFLNPHDQVMLGALIAAFAAAWGYWIGSTAGNGELRRQVGTGLDIINKTSPASDEVTTLTKTVSVN